MILSVVMIVLSALNIGVDNQNITSPIINIVLFSILFLFASVGMGIIITIKHSTTAKTKYDNKN